VVLVAAAWAGCGRSEIADVERYARILNEREPDPEPALRECGQIREPGLAGDCALVVAQRAAVVRREPPEAWCDRVPEGIWRWECLFSAAEVSRRQKEVGKAAELCRQSGPFVEDCAQHLWQSPVHRLIHGDNPPKFADKLARAEELYAKWEPMLGEFSDLEGRFWTKYYQNGFEGAGWIDLAWCDPLPEAHRARCLEAAKELVIREIAPALDREGAWEGFCAAEPPSAEQLQRWLRVALSPAMEALVAERRAALCQG
jgi:hypothetical protein